MRLDLAGLLPRPLLPAERRRIADGRRALKLPEPRTLRGMRSQVERLRDGARALQSLDDLGTPEANTRVCDAMEWLCSKADRLAEHVRAAGKDGARP